MNHTTITFKYLDLLAKAERTDNRKEAISLINQATSLLNTSKAQVKTAEIDRE
jgi:hypothetical protein